MQEIPFVSIVVPMRNEAEFIFNCLTSLMTQDYPHNRFEVIVVDGRSTDDSKELVLSFRCRDVNLRLIDNPRQITSTALNIGIQSALGDVIIILGAHTQVGSNFIAQNVHVLKRTCADFVGGPIQTIGNSFFGKAIALALSTPFGVGNAKFRYSQREEYVDTVAFPACRRNVFDRVGLFNETLIRNQDIEFSSRLRRNGGKILLSPNIKIAYYCRSSLVWLVKQSFRNGFWNIYTYWQTPGSLSNRHFVPMFFMWGLLLSALTIHFSSFGLFLLFLILLPYFLLNLLFSMKISIKHGLMYALVMPFVFLTLHVSYGSGSIAGIVSLLLSYFIFRR